jgi:signal transduction histidine kinase
MNSKNMLNFFGDYWDIIKRHLRNVIIFFISINIMAIISFSVVFDNHIDYINNQMNNNIIEYGEIDREQLCKLSECKKIYVPSLKKTYKPDGKGHLHKIDYKVENYYTIHKELKMNEGFEMSILNELSESYYVIDMKKMISDYLFVLYVFIPISMLIFMYPLIKSIREEKAEAILALAGNEALLANKTMINITENIHHELNTPLEVIDNKLEKIHRIVTNVIIDEQKYTKDLDMIPEDRVKRNKKLINLEKDFDFIKTSSEQIYSILEKMKGFKHLRYSNGNKTLVDIIDGGFKIINISNSNFETAVDERLGDYSLLREGLKNADLLSILLNHFKNSLEADASKILVLFSHYENGFLSIRIIDNGNGIPEEIQSKIFKANFSTKIGDSGIRGNGMYLNRHIVGSVGGSITLIGSSNKGTTIELKIPAKMKNNGENK